MHKVSLIMHSTDIIFIAEVHITLTKLYVKFQSDPLKIFWAKVEKVQKMHKSCLTMLIKPSKNWLKVQSWLNCLINHLISWYGYMKMVCFSLFHSFTTKHLKKKLRIQKVSIKKILKSDWSHSYPIINPRSKFFPNTALNSNDEPYCPLLSCEQ